MSCTIPKEALESFARVILPDIYKFYEYIYCNATFYMKRKKDKFDKFIKERMQVLIMN